MADSVLSGNSQKPFVNPGLFSDRRLKMTFPWHMMYFSNVFSACDDQTGIDASKQVSSSLNGDWHDGVTWHEPIRARGFQRTCMTSLVNKLWGAGDRFGDYLCDDCTNMPCVSGHNQFTNTLNLQTHNSPDLLPKFQSILINSHCNVQ